MLTPSVKKITVIVFVILAAVFIAVSMTESGRRLSNGAFSVFVHCCQSVIDWGDSRVRSFTPGQESDIVKIAKLEGEIAELKALSASSEMLKEENNQLRSLVGLNKISGWQAVTAEIIARNPATWNTSFTINRGERDGIREGYAVIAGMHIIGRIGSCSPHSCEVNTILSSKCRFSVRLEGTDYSGGCIGQDNASGCLIEFLPKNIDVRHGQKILTSGLGGWMPDGLPVGSLIAFRDGNVKHIVDDSQTQLLMAPYSAFERVRFVSVLVK